MAMVELNEVPGALERPAGCAIRVFGGDGEYRIEIPPRGASPIMWLAAFGLTVVLIGWIAMGLILMITGKPVFILAGIMTHGLTKSMFQYRFLLGGFVFLALSFGVAELFSMLRHNTLRESLVFADQTLKHARKVGRLEQANEYPYSTVRSFVVAKDPHGITHARLMLICQGDEREVGEFLRNNDREWLCSVCNGLLRTR